MSNRKAIDEAELLANRLIKFLMEYSDAGAWSAKVLDKLEGAFTSIIHDLLKEEWDRREMTKRYAAVTVDPNALSSATAESFTSLVNKQKEDQAKRDLMEMQKEACERLARQFPKVTL